MMRSTIGMKFMTQYMSKTFFMGLACVLLLASFAQAQDLTPAQTLDVLLDRIEAKSDQIKTYQAALRYDQIQGLLGDQQTRYGAIYYKAGPPAQFCIHFQRVVIDGKLQKQNRRWIYDGQWLVERLDDKKQIFKRQLKPSANNAPLALEDSPFPIPLTIKKDRILKRFAVTLEPANPDAEVKEPKNSYHLKLIPHANSTIEFSRIDLWYDRDTLLPLKCHTFKEDSDDEQIFELFKAVANEPLDAKYIDTSIPTERGWQVEITPWED